MKGLPRHELYKDSGVSWIEEIPFSWRTERAKWLFQRMERPIRLEDEVVTAFRNGQVTLRKNRREEGFTNALQEHGYQGIRKGDLVIHAMDAFAGAIGVSDSDGKSTPFYSACIPRGKYYVNNYYYAYLLRYMSQSGFIQALAKGIRERSTDFRFNDFANLWLPIPSREEQDKIVSFLDQKTTEIDAAINKKQRLIELLQEQKAILINQAVTKGLNQDALQLQAKNKFFPGIPKGSRLIRLGHLCTRIVDGPHFSPNYVDEGYMFISAGNIRTDRWLLKDVKYVSEKDYREFCKRVTPEIGDVLYTKGGTTGVARVVDIEEPFQVWVHVAVLKIKKEIVNPFYLAYALNSAKCYEQSQLYTRGATNNDLGLTRMSDIYLPLPKMEAQSEIVTYLDKQLGQFSQAIEITEKEIARLSELKVVLMQNAVTGKIKV